MHKQPMKKPIMIVVEYMLFYLNIANSSFYNAFLSSSISLKKADTTMLRRSKSKKQTEVTGIQQLVLFLTLNHV
jgi:hypothetical protein